MEKSYIAIDLKSFYASVECRERGLNALDANLVVADESRTDKTICLAVSPSLKSYGIPGRPRLFEVKSKINHENRLRMAKGEKSWLKSELDADINRQIDFLIARPRMGLYVEYSTRIYNIYLKYVSPEDVHVYSIDEVFIDVTPYLKTYNTTPRELAMTMIRDVLRETGITATAGIGTNLYLAKIAMDIVAKHMPPDEDGVRIAELDEFSYRRDLWNHKPLTDFWRIGRGYQKRLASIGLYTMGQIAKCSIGDKSDYYNENLLYKTFGINAELLIDHAWGYEPVTIKDIKDYRPENNSISTGQVLPEPYDYEGGRLVVHEMADLLSLDLVDKRLVCDQIVLTVGYDIENIKDKKRASVYTGKITVDHYGRAVPEHAHGTINLPSYTSSTKQIIAHVLELYKRIVDENLLIRRINITANHVITELKAKKKEEFSQLSFFDSDDGVCMPGNDDETEKEKDIQHAILDIKKRYGKNAILKGINHLDGATAKTRNEQIGGHRR